MRSFLSESKERKNTHFLKGTSPTTLFLLSLLPSSFFLPPSSFFSPLFSSSSFFSQQRRITFPPLFSALFPSSYAFSARAVLLLSCSSHSSGHTQNTHRQTFLRKNINFYYHPPIQKTSLFHLFIYFFQSRSSALTRLFTRTGVSHQDSPNIYTGYCDECIIIYLFCV